MTGLDTDAGNDGSPQGPRGLHRRLMGHRFIQAAHGDGLKAKAIRGAGWTIGGYGAQQVLRMGSSIVLTRLLFPEAYGIMAIANVYMIGLQMFSDVGLRQSVIQNPRGKDPDFLNTVWTMQIVRGFVLWLISCAIAYPVSKFYGEPILFPVLCVLGFSAAVRGFQTTVYATANRDLRLGKITILELVTQGIGIVVTVVWAMFHSSVWALAGGGAISAVLAVILGFAVLPGHAHRLRWEKSAASDLFRFGRWIFLATILGYFANYGDRLILGKFMSAADFGVYSLAITWTGLIRHINNKVGDRVLIPIYAAKRDATPEEMRPKIHKMRLAKAGVALPISAFLILFGQAMISLMYDSRYHDAGWMLQAIAVGVGFHAVMNIGDFMLSRGRSGLFFVVVVLDSITTLLCMTIGGAVAGPSGIVFGVAATPIIKHLYMILIYRSYGYWVWKLDAAFAFIFVLLAYAAVLIQHAGTS